MHIYLLNTDQRHIEFAPGVTSDADGDKHGQDQGDKGICPRCRDRALLDVDVDCQTTYLSADGAPAFTACRACGEVQQRRVVNGDGGAFVQDSMPVTIVDRVGGDGFSSRRLLLDGGVEGMDIQKVDDGSMEVVEEAEDEVDTLPAPTTVLPTPPTRTTRHSSPPPNHRLHSARESLRVLLPSSTSTAISIPSSSSTPTHGNSPFPSRSSPHPTSPYSPSPTADITRLRVRPPTHPVLYAGSTFSGTQKSGRNSYEVTVTLLSVDLAASFLCGYLRIKGLTDDWPDMTTYFDAQIIGDKYGFVTGDWGASYQEDVVHWARFPAWKDVSGRVEGPSMIVPGGTADDGGWGRGAVFMRWKERFLVPDHRVQDINGASFAGFYYVCVSYDNPGLQDAESIESTTRRPSWRTTNPHAQAADPVATMSGFYFHQASEPYQQLSLTHVQNRFVSSYEFR